MRRGDRKLILAACGVLVGGLGPPVTCADPIIYGYEGSVLPYDASEGWIVANSCVPPCGDSILAGRYRLLWSQANDVFNYHYWITQSPAPQPPTLWVEWRFRSNHAVGPNFTGCDGWLVINYGGFLELVYMYGDYAESFEGGQTISGLALNQFHTYRLESVDGENYRVAVNGQVFIVDSENDFDATAYLQLGGNGGCLGDEFPNMINEWDFVRYGTIDSGEQVVSTDPPSGTLGPGGYTSFTTFRVTFDSPNYVYIDDIAVEVTGGTAPIVTATRRTDTNGPETVEIVLNGPLPQNQRTRFTLTDAAGSQIIDYDFRTIAPIPATSTNGLIATVVILVFAGAMIARNRVA